MRNLICLLFVLLLGCEDSGDGNMLSSVGESCSNKADCESGLTCINQMCQQVGVDCSVKNYCDAGLVECGLDPLCGQSCGSCDYDEVCQNGQCMWRGLGDMTVEWWKDPVSKLTWQNSPAESQFSPVNWFKAKQYCSSLNPDGGRWRLPTIGELRTLIRGCPATELGGGCNIKEGDCLHLSCRDELCDDDCYYADSQLSWYGCLWPNEIQGYCEIYWSSSVDNKFDNDESIVWVVDFMYGGVEDHAAYFFESGKPKGQGSLVRCVR